MSNLFTDAELKAKLETDRRQREMIIERYRRAESPLLDELRAIGINVRTAWDLREWQEPYQSAIPILIEHLTRDYPPNVRKGIAMALGKKWARELAWEPLVKIYSMEPNLSGPALAGEIGAPSEPKDQMAVSISEMAKPEDLKEVVGLLENPQNGMSRVLLVRKVARSGSEYAFEALARLSSDPDLKEEVALVLKSKLRRQAKKLGPSGART